MGKAIIIEPLAMAAITASNTASGYDADYLGPDAQAADMIGVTWKSDTGAASRNLIVDLGSDVAFDTALLIGAVGATSGWQLKVEIATEAQGIGFAGAWEGSVEDFLAGSAMPVNGLGKALWIAPSGAPAAGRYVRFTISGLSSAAAQLGRIVIGQRIQLERNFAFGAAFGVQTLGAVDFSRRGVALPRSGAKLRALGITFKGVKRDEVEEAVQPLFERIGNDTTIAIVIDPDAHAQRQTRMFFGYLTGNIGTIWPRAGSFEAGCNLVALD